MNIDHSEIYPFSTTMAAPGEKKKKEKKEKKREEKKERRTGSNVKVIWLTA